MRQRLWKLGCAGVTGRTEEGPGGSCAQSHPSPSTLFPLLNCREALKASPSRTQPSQLCIHPFQSASSKQVYTTRRKETTAHNHRADALSFQSSFLKHWGSCAGKWRKNKNCSAYGLGLQGGRNSAGSGHGATAPSSGRAVRRTRLVRAVK